MANNSLKPVHLKVVDKAHQHLYDYDNPEPSKDWPVTPSRLSPKAAGIFERMVLRIAELYPPSASHTEILAIYAEAEEDYLELSAYIKWNGRTFTTDNGQIKPYPEVAMRNEAKNTMEKILKEFGLSPASSRNVKMQKKQEKRNSFADLDD